MMDQDEFLKVLSKYREHDVVNVWKAFHEMLKGFETTVGSDVEKN